MVNLHKIGNSDFEKIIYVTNTFEEQNEFKNIIRYLNMIIIFYVGKLDIN